MAISGSACWGHSTGVTEDNTRTFAGNWAGTGSITGAGDGEEICLDAGEYMISEVVDTGTYTVTLFQNDYAAGDNVTMYYRHGATELACQAAAWNLYVAGFVSLGYVQVKLEASEPLRVSSSNGRYLENVYGTGVFLTGFHTWYDVQDGGSSDPPDAMDWDEYLAALVSYGCNFTKLWAMESNQNWSDTDGQYFDPIRYTRTGPGNGNDGKLKVDLTQVNSTYLARLRARAIDCLDAGIYVCVQFFQGWQVEIDKGGTGDPCTYHPYLSANNINSLDGDFDDDGELLETHSDSNNNAWATQQALINAIVDYVGDLPNIIWEVSNETTGSQNAYDWQEDIVAQIQGREDAQSFHRHPIGMTKFWPENTIGDDDLIASAAAWVSYSATYADATADGTRVSMYDTDHTVGLTDTYSWIWESLCNGHGGAWYMDEWDGALYGSDRRENATYMLIRDQLGYADDIANSRVNNLLLMTPQPALCSTGYCLAYDHATAAEYICYQSGTGNFTLDLTTATGNLNIFWRRCSNGDTDTDDTVAGGDVRTLTVPWAGACVAYVYHS